MQAVGRRHGSQEVVNIQKIKRKSRVRWWRLNNIGAAPGGIICVDWHWSWVTSECESKVNKRQGNDIWRLLSTMLRESRGHVQKATKLKTSTNVVLSAIFLLVKYFYYSLCVSVMNLCHDFQAEKSIRGQGLQMSLGLKPYMSCYHNLLPCLLHCPCQID